MRHKLIIAFLFIGFLSPLHADDRTPATVGQAIAALKRTFWIIDSVHSPAVLYESDAFKFLKANREDATSAIKLHLNAIKSVADIATDLPYLAWFLEMTEDRSCRGEAKRIAEMILEFEPNQMKKGSADMLVAYHYLRRYLGSEGGDLPKLPPNGFSDQFIDAIEKRREAEDEGWSVKRG